MTGKGNIFNEEKVLFFANEPQGFHLQANERKGSDAQRITQSLLDRKLIEPVPSLKAPGAFFRTTKAGQIRLLQLQIQWRKNNQRNVEQQEARLHELQAQLVQPSQPVTYTENEVFTAMVLAEIANAELRNEAGPFYDYCIVQQKGICDLRQALISLIPLVEAAYESVKDDYDDPFDMEFVPDLLDSLRDPLNASEAEYLAAARSLAVKAPF